jgi:hypothetical protein
MLTHAAVADRGQGHIWRFRMQAIIRQYAGAGAVELFDLLEQHSADVQALMQTVEGLISYTLVRTQGGGFSVTVARDQAAIDMTNQRAREWIAKNGVAVKAAPPTMSSGRVIAFTK